MSLGWCVCTNVARAPLFSLCRVKVCNRTDRTIRRVFGDAVVHTAQSSLSSH